MCATIIIIYIMAKCVNLLPVFVLFVSGFPYSRYYKYILLQNLEIFSLFSFFLVFGFPYFDHETLRPTCMHHATHALAALNQLTSYSVQVT